MGGIKSAGGARVAVAFRQHMITTCTCTLKNVFFGVGTTLIYKTLQRQKTNAIAQVPICLLVSHKIIALKAQSHWRQIKATRFATSLRIISDCLKTIVRT